MAKRQWDRGFRHTQAHVLAARWAAGVGASIAKTSDTMTKRTILFLMAMTAACGSTTTGGTSIGTGGGGGSFDTSVIPATWACYGQTCKKGQVCVSVGDEVSGSTSSCSDLPADCAAQPTVSCLEAACGGDPDAVGAYCDNTGCFSSCNTF